MRSDAPPQGAGHHRPPSDTLHHPTAYHNAPPHHLHGGMQLSPHGDIEEPILPVQRRRQPPQQQADAQAALLGGFVNDDELKGNSWSQVKDALLDEMKSATEPIASWFGGFWGSKPSPSNATGRESFAGNPQYSFEEGVTPLVTVNMHGSAYGGPMYPNTANGNFNESVSLRATDTVRIVDASGEVHLIPRQPGNQAAVGVVYGQDPRTPRDERKRPGRSLMTRATDLGQRGQPQPVQDYYSEYNGGYGGGAPYDHQQQAAYNTYRQEGSYYEDYYNPSAQAHGVYGDGTVPAMYGYAQGADTEGYLTALLDAVDKYRRSNPHGCPSDKSLDGNRRCIRSVSLSNLGENSLEDNTVNSINSLRVGRSFSLHRCFRNTGHRLIVRNAGARTNRTAAYDPNIDAASAIGGPLGGGVNAPSAYGYQTPRDAYGNPTGHHMPHGAYSGGPHGYTGCGPQYYGQWNGQHAPMHPHDGPPQDMQYYDDTGHYGGAVYDQQQYYGQQHPHGEWQDNGYHSAPGGRRWAAPHSGGAMLQQPETARKTSGASTDLNLTAADGLTVSAPSTGRQRPGSDTMEAGTGVAQDSDTTGTNNVGNNKKANQVEEEEVNEALNLYTASEISKIRMFVQKVYKTNFEGWLEKSNPSGWGYKTRFVRIRNFDMSYMKSPHDDNALGTLKLASSVWHAEARQDANSFSMKAEDDPRIYLWRLPQNSTHNRSQWLDAIRKCFKAVAFVRQLKDAVDCRKPEA